MANIDLHKMLREAMRGLGHRLDWSDVLGSSKLINVQCRRCGNFYVATAMGVVELVEQRAPQRCKAVKRG